MSQGKLGGQFAYRLLKALCRRPPAVPQSAYDLESSSPLAGVVDAQAVVDLNEVQVGAAKLERFLGRQVWHDLADRRVLDFGCGSGAEAVAAALRGAEHVVGLEIQPTRLDLARRLSEAAGVADRCTFLHPFDQAAQLNDWAGTFDVAYSLDAFEHFAAPEAILAELHRLLAPGGRLLVSFGPPWKHPYGCHLKFMTRCPWIHLLFDEATILRVRSEFRSDGAQSFAEVEGGLNRMTLARFEQLIAADGWQVEQLRPVPLSSRLIHANHRWLRPLAWRSWREYLTAIVLCRLIKTTPSAAAAVDADLAVAV